MKGRKKLESRDRIMLQIETEKEVTVCGRANSWQQDMAPLIPRYIHTNCSFELVLIDRSLAGLTHGSSPPPAPTELAAQSWRVVDEERRRSLWRR